MKCDLLVAAPPPNPLLVFDGDCRFCTLWIKRWRQTTGERVDYLPFQDASIAERFPEIPRKQFETAVLLIETDGRVYAGAEAALRALAKNPARRWLLWSYGHLPGAAVVAERCYRFVAEHRPVFSKMTRFGWGNHVEVPSHFLTRWIFLRGLGVIYLIAFLSLWVQLNGLIGSKGLLPAGSFMTGAARYFDSQGAGANRYLELPTLCWLNAGDGFLHFLCAAGVVLSVMLTVGVAPMAVLIALWAVYLSLSVVGQTFFSFQWDTLLLETGFFAILLAPRQWLPGLSRESPPSRASVWLLRWLLFRLMFQSGLTKLLYDDPTWRNFTALTFHYETQPLPTWIGWCAHQWPSVFHQFSCAVMYFIEIVVPFLFFAPRRLRIVACPATVLLQALIGLTGNYNFFNLLTVALCVPLLDDATWQSCCRRVPFLGRWAQWQPPARAMAAAWRWWLLGLVTVIVVLITSVEMLANFRVNFPWPKPVVQLTQAIAPLRTLNSYGLFRVMTRPRYEIIIEGSYDGITWRPYEFKWKPGDENRRPGFVAPHQPRLDWQMWFEALRTQDRQRPSLWFISLCMHLLQGSPETLGLLANNPFPKKPPRFIRATAYEYHFTDSAERGRTGAWWKRKPVGEYLPPISMRQGNGQPRSN